MLKMLSDFCKNTSSVTLFQKHERGLDVCLKCYTGSCADQGSTHNHSVLHGGSKGHPIFMNIKLIPKAVDPVTGNLKSQQVTKLAIGMPGGVDAETDKYDTSVVVHCRECNSDIPLAHARVASLVDSVLLANSAYNQSSISEWELELKSCAHIKSLDQSHSSRIAEKNLASCGKCDLKANLWLCMTCGHLGCGR